MSGVRWTRAMERAALLAHAAELEAQAAAARLRAELLEVEAFAEASDAAAFERLSGEEIALAGLARGRGLA